MGLLSVILLLRTLYYGGWWYYIGIIMWPFGDILTEKQKSIFHQTVQFRKKQTTPKKTIFAGYKGYGMFWDYYRKNSSRKCDK